MYFKTFFKKTHLLMLLLAIIMPWQMKAQEVVTVCDGTAPNTTTATNSYIPIYGSYVDTQGTTSEFIIPATTEGMDDLVGGEISKLTFYISNSPASWGSPVIQIYMGEVEGTTLSNLYGPTNANVTIVAEKTLSNTQAEMEIELDTPYTYEGGNLLIGTYVKTKSNTYKATNFSGISAPYGSSWNKYSSYGSGSAQSFLPKTTFTYTPAGGMSCAKPLSITPDNITSNSATIYWTGESDTYNVQYKKSTDSEWTNRATNYSGYSIELTGLESNTSYQVQIQSICEGNVLSGWKSASFKTPCAAENTFPFYENFNTLTTNGEIPECWNNDEGTSTNANYKWSYYATGHEGKCVRFNSYSNSYNTNFLKTVPMNLPANKTMQLRFWYKNPTGGDFSIYISTDGGTTHTTALEEHLANQTDWSEEEIVLGNYVGQNNVVIVFKGTSNNGSGDAYIYLDDVYVEEAPTCPKQNALHVTTLTSSSVTLDWTAGTNDQDHWDLFITTDATITPDANTTPTVINSNQKPFTHNGVNDGTTYYAYVRARCSDNDQSPWTAACKFTTPQIPVTIDGNHPYSTDFETDCDWMFINGDYTNKWCFGSAANNTTNGTKAIYISNDNGTTNAYSAVKSVEYATKNFSFAEGVYTFSFDWRAKGNQYYDFIRVALVPASVELVSADNAPFDGTSLPAGWIALDGGSKLNNSDSWQTVVADEISVPTGEYKMVFGWRNFTYSVTQPPAAIDNVSISLLTCPRPTSLTSSDITGRTATLTWTENGSATEWVLEYGTTSDFTGATSVNVSETPNKLLTGLAPETQYYARVKASCSSTDESVWSNTINFTTLATCPKPTLSYVSYSATAYTGTVQWTGSTADAFEVAYRPTNDFDPSDYTLENVTRVLLENVSEYNYTLENLNPETKYYIYVQADCGSEDGKSSWSNRVIFTTLETCLPPSGLSTSTTSSTVTLSWTAGAEGQDAWDIRYKKSTDSDYTYIHLDNHPTTSYTITGLSPVTTYGVNVRAYCSETDQSKWGASTANQSYDKSVTTDCGTIELPYTCDFEGPSQTINNCLIPSCWSVIRGYYNSTYRYGVPTMATQSTSTQPIVQQTHSGSYSLYFLNSTNYGTTEEYAILPEISDKYNMSNVQIRFWVRSYSSACSMEVGIMTDPSNANSYVQVEVVDMTNTYVEKTVSLSNYSGNGRYIALKCPAPTMYSQAFYVDDITVEYIPSCQIPDNLDADEVGVNQTTLSWTPRGTETAWNVQYKKVSESEWNEPITVDETTYTLNGLQRATEYEVRVQANCSTDDQSEWTNPISFTTECGIWPIDAHNGLFEDFENVDASDFPPICWEKFSHEMSGYTYWYLNSNNGLGSSAAFSYWNEGYAFLVMPQMYIDGNAILSFDHLISDGSYNGNCSVVVSTETMTYDNFSTTIWEGNGPTSGKASETVSLSAFNGQDIYIAFKYKGAECTWYIDNVQIYVPITQTVELAQGWNWWSPTVEVSLEALETALGTNGITIKSQTEAVTYEDEEWLGDDFTLIPGQMYKIKVSADCEFNLTGKALYSTTITIKPGYNWFGYTSTQVISVNDAFEDLNPNEGDVIKSLENSTTFEDGEWIGDITNLQPGHGYVYISTSTENKTVTFP